MCDCETCNNQTRMLVAQEALQAEMQQKIQDQMQTQCQTMFDQIIEKAKARAVEMIALGQVQDGPIEFSLAESPQDPNRYCSDCGQYHEKKFVKKHWKKHRQRH